MVEPRIVIMKEIKLIINHFENDQKYLLNSTIYKGLQAHLLNVKWNIF